MNSYSIKSKARNETLKILVRRMCLVNVMEVLDIYGQCIEQNGGSKEYAVECVTELLEEYLSE